MSERPNFKNILVLGDSISDGFYDSEGAGWVGRLEELLHNDAPLMWGMQNFSVSGDRIIDVLYRLNGFLTTKDTDYLFVAVGVNDIFRYGSEDAPVSMALELRHDYWARLFKLAKPFVKKVFVFSLLPVNESLNGKFTDDFGTKLINLNKDIVEYNSEIKNWAEEHDAVFIDLYSFFFEQGHENLLFDDSHPNSTGHELLAHWVYKELRGKI